MPTNIPMAVARLSSKAGNGIAKTELVRFENYFETGRRRQSPCRIWMPMEAFPKREDKVRLTALRSGEVDMIENMSYFDAPDFIKNESEKYNIFKSPQVGLAHFCIQAKSGPFAMSGGKDAKMLRQAVMHAIDKEAMHQAVFNGLGEKMDTFYCVGFALAPARREEGAGIRSGEDPVHLNKLNMANMPIAVVSRQAYQYMRNGGEILHAMLLEAGFRSHERSVRQPGVCRPSTRKMITASTRPLPASALIRRPLWPLDPLPAPDNKRRTGFVSERCDELIDEAAATTDFNLRKEMYTEVDSIVNDECCVHLSSLGAVDRCSVKNLKGYAPQLTGGPNYKAAVSARRTSTAKRMTRPPPCYTRGRRPASSICNDKTANQTRPVDSAC